MRTKTQHTPGPWTEYNSDKGRIFKQWRVNAGTFHKVATIAARASSEEEYANAKLIACAPMLLEALQTLLDCSPCRNGCAPDDMTCASNKARAAIASATGQKRGGGE